MKILFLSLFLPHPQADHAAAFSDYNLIRHLSQRNHQISVLSFVRSREESAFAETLHDCCERVETVLLPDCLANKIRSRVRWCAMIPIAVSQSHSREMAKKIRLLTESEQYEVIHVEYTPMGQYLKSIPRHQGVRVMNVHDLIGDQMRHRAAHLPWSRKKMECWLDSLVAPSYERRICSQFNLVLTASRQIHQTLLGYRLPCPVRYMPPGVIIPDQRKGHAGPGRRLLFMGAMWRQENIDAVLYFYHQVFQRIRAHIPEAVLTVAGGAPAESIKRLSQDPHVDVTGYVPNLLPCYLRSDVSIAPMRIAGGVLCKILDAMAVGLPVITTSAGNLGVGARPPEEILVADQPEEFAAQAVRLLRDATLRKTISTNAIDFVRSNYSWEKIIRSVEATYLRLLCAASLTAEPVFLM